MTEPADAVKQIKAAFAADDADAVRSLLKSHAGLRAGINEPNGPFDSPAVVGVRSRQMLDVLLEAGADINARSRWWAGGFGLLDSAEPELAAYAIGRGATVTVHAAARLGLMDSLRDHLGRDPDLVRARGGDGQTPLHFARSVEVAAYLLDHGAEIDALDVDHESTPAQYMTGDRHEVARFLIARGCRTDLLMAAAVGDVDLVRRTLDANPEAIRLRVSDEYFPMIGGKAGGTIYQWTLGWYVFAHQVARKFDRDEVLALLMERSPPALRLIDACWAGDDAAIEALRPEVPAIARALSAADVREVAHAARNNETGAVRRLLHCAFPVDATSQHRATPLHWAAFHGNLEMTNTLLGFNPPLDVVDADFHSTPLGWAIHGSENGWYRETGDYGAVVEALLEAGAPIPPTIKGSPPVQQALRRRAPDPSE